jgi:hypothetical protein
MADANENSNTYEYDDLNRLINTTDPDGERINKDMIKILLQRIIVSLSLSLFLFGILFMINTRYNFGIKNIYLLICTSLIFLLMTLFPNQIFKIFYSIIKILGDL